MKSFLSVLLVVGAVWGWSFCPLYGQTPAPAPDEIVLRDGSTVRGLILENTAQSVLLQVGSEERRIDKKDIARIRDEDGKMTEHIMTQRPGTLPSLRVMVNDLRTQDSVRSLFQIPAVRIDEDDFRRIPYTSFLINNNMELNIYGPANRPVGVEIGIFGPRRDLLRAREDVRAYLAGFLSSRAEIAALYAVDLDGGLARAGKMTIEVTPPDAPEAEDSWWMSLYLHDELNKHRLSPAAYAKVTIPPGDDRLISARNARRNIGTDILGQVLRLWEMGDDATEDLFDQTRDVVQVGNALSGQAVKFTGQSASAFLGFFRDKQGRFRLVPFDLPGNDDES